MTMFIITDGNNNVSRDKPVEHIDIDNGLHVSACTSCTRTMRVRRDIAIDITESVHLLVRFKTLRSMPVMPKLEHYDVDAMHARAAAALEPGKRCRSYTPTEGRAHTLHVSGTHSE